MSVIKIFKYHCSPVKISEFDLSQGCHFGGYLSALEAGLRKVDGGKLYVHEVRICFNNSITTDDLCNKEGWDKLCLEMRQQNIEVASYRNIHEPDFSSSYFVVDPVSIEILNVTEINSQTAEREIESALY